MILIVSILTGIAFAMVIVTLIMGGISMQKKGDHAKTSNKWMQRRVLAQAAAVLMLILLIFLRSKGA